MSGNCANCEAKKKFGLQTKLMVGEPDDVCEREADHVARQIVTGRSPGKIGRAAPISIRSQSSQRGSVATEAPVSSIDAALADSGRPLEPLLRADMEQRFDHDFSRVRVHTGTAADRSAHELDAHAYTLGRDLVFGAGRYAPQSSAGRELLAHELTHVVQQARATAPGAGGGLVQRGGKKGPTTKPHSCGGWTCAASGDCAKPDGKAAASATASTSWSLTANLDLDVLKASDVSGGDTVGHAFVEFKESNGDRYTYGHYHNKTQSPDPVFHVEVPGCTAHPDQTHSGCIDMRINYALPQADYRKALDFAQSWCIASPPYNLQTSNCTSFVDKVVGVAGKTLPSSRGQVGGGTLGTTADNPNTLFDTQVSQADNATWRERVSGDFTGSYDDGSGKTIAFTKFELKSDDKLVVAGKYSYIGSSGDPVEGTLDGRLVFDVDGTTKMVTVSVPFNWSEPGGSGKGVWSVGSTGDLKGDWGRGAAASGAGGWRLSKKP